MPGETDAGDENLEATSSTLKRGPGRPRKLLTKRPGRPKKLYNMVNEYVAVVDNLDPGTVKVALEDLLPKDLRNFPVLTLMKHLLQLLEWL